MDCNVGPDFIQCATLLENVHNICRGFAEQESSQYQVNLYDSPSVTSYLKCTQLQIII